MSSADLGIIATPESAGLAPAAGCYVRTAFNVRTDEHLHALEEQMIRCAELANGDGRRISAHHDFFFVDAGFSAFSMDRPALTRLLDIIRRDQARFDRLYVVGPERLIRSPDLRQISMLIAELAEHGVEVRW
jgi:DNA invertase Pin-like site-specific DNA recombinase